MTAIVGYSGFVGSNLLQFIKFDYFYNSKNFQDASNMKFDNMYFCGIPAVKWYANKYPEEDTKIFENIKLILDTITVNNFFHISTIDVYDNINSILTEDDSINYHNNHTYGKNRFLFEEYLKKRFNNVYIIRLPALFGKGLKKNILFDLLNNNMVEKIIPTTYFQWYDLNWLKNDIDMIIKNNIKLINLFTEPVLTSDIIDLFDYSKNIFNYNLIGNNYNTKTKYSSSGYIRDKNQVLNSIKEFIKFYKINKDNLVVSNICLNNISHFQFACILKLYGISHVQIAPTTLTLWEKLNDINFNDYSMNNIKVYSLQSLTYGIDNMHIFENTDFFIKHMTNVINIAKKNNIRVLVFGCPKNRYIKTSDDKNHFINIFRVLGDLCTPDIFICIEPNAKEYGCNFINNINEAGEIVTEINHNNIKMMIDSGNIIMENDNIFDIYKYKDYIYNVDFSMPYMNKFIQMGYHSEIKNILNSFNYKYKINLEMRKNNENELEILNESLFNFINIFS